MLQTRGLELPLHRGAEASHRLLQFAEHTRMHEPDID
jgi:hypothetical protein